MLLQDVTFEGLIKYLFYLVQYFKPYKKMSALK